MTLPPGVEHSCGAERRFLTGSQEPRVRRNLVVHLNAHRCDTYESVWGQYPQIEGCFPGHNPGSSTAVYSFCPFHRVSFQTAQDICLAHDANLVTITTLAEQTLVEVGVVSLSKYYGSLVDTAWIGLTDTVAEGAWEWVSGGTDADFSNWGAGEPDGTSDAAGRPKANAVECVRKGADCAVLSRNIEGQSHHRGGWNDRCCDELHAFVCQYLPLK